MRLYGKNKNNKQNLHPSLLQIIHIKKKEKEKTRKEIHFLV